jgi:hypothetical protein
MNPPKYSPVTLSTNTPVLGAAAEVLGPAPRTPEGMVGEGPTGVLDDRSEF